MRRMLPLAILIALVSSFLLFFWILVYIFGCYRPEDDMVWNGSGDKAETEEEELHGNNYHKESKNEYAKKNVIFHIFSFLFFLIYWF